MIAEQMWFNSILYMFTGLIVGYLLGRLHERSSIEQPEVQKDESEKPL